MENIKNNISKEKLFDYCNGICTEDDINEIEKALSQSEELRAEVDNIRIVLALDTDIREYQAIDTDSAFEEVWGKVDKRKHSFRIDSLMRYAAIFSIPLLISTMVFGYLYFSGSEKDSMSYAEVFTSPGTITRYELPDKTVVWLNSDSKLRYPSRFDSAEREVYLEGEAYFEVHADKKHPFYVNMNNGMRVYAYGTKFNVNTYDEAGRLSEVRMTETTDMLPGKDNSGAFVTTSKSSRKYVYNNDTDYVVMEFVDMLSEVKTIKYSAGTKEELWLENNQDTVMYSFEKYRDKDKLEYRKDVSKHNGTPPEEWRSETFYDYDKNGNLVKCVEHDLCTGVKTARYFFEGITYDEALRRVPESRYKPKIVCKVRADNRDTIITQTVVDGLLDEVLKEYRHNGLKVVVSRTILDKGYLIDSIYYKKDRKLRTVIIDSTDAISEFDEKGNPVKEVSKMKHNGLSPRKSL